MPSQSHRTSANSGRRTHHESLGWSYYDPAQRRVSSRAPPLTYTAPSLVDQLNEVCAREKNAIAERDRYFRMVDDVSKELERYKKAMIDLKEANKTLRAQQATLLNENRELLFDKQKLQNEMCGLQAKFENVELKYNALKKPDPDNPMVAPTPDRSKKSSAGTSSASGTSASSSSRTQQEAERGRAREKEMQDERLASRFDKRTPPTSGSGKHSRRKSNTDGYASSGPRSRSAAPPAIRTFSHVSHAHYDEPVMSPREQTQYSKVPRTVPAPSPGRYSSGSSSNGLYYDEVASPNYKPYP